ncbi:MAG: DUF4359 domain-containing protein [FCB group bacterium]|nr:DUF4359 domain-containing protein [FCB group bacterium]
MKMSLIVVLLICILLIVTNPTKDNFYEWADKKAQKASISELEGVLARIIRSPLLRIATVRNDYVLFSIFTIKVEESKDVYLGILKQFIRIKSTLNLIE